MQDGGLMGWRCVYNGARGGERETYHHCPGDAAAAAAAAGGMGAAALHGQGGLGRTCFPGLLLRVLLLVVVAPVSVCVCVLYQRGEKEACGV